MAIQELCLQMEVDSSTSVPTAFGVLNRALHSIAAHLQRYGSELASMREALSDIVRHHNDFLKGARAVPFDPARHTNLVGDGLDELVAHLRQVEAFLQELKVKVENILALVGCEPFGLKPRLRLVLIFVQLFSCIQIANDRRMVANGEKMHAILEATQDDAKVSRDIAEQSKAIAEQSRILAEEMKQDSVAMKTVSLVRPPDSGIDSHLDRCHYHVFPSRNIFCGR